MTIRKIIGLKWAAPIARPGCIPVPRVRAAAKKNGLRYERRFAELFPSALHGQWFEFEDRRGHGYCQPDLIISFLPSYLVVCEVKYTLTSEAFRQLNGLYLPVVHRALRTPVLGVVVVKNLNSIGEAVHIAADLEGAVGFAKDGRRAVLHWVGQPVSRMSAKPPSILPAKPVPETPISPAPALGQLHQTPSTSPSTAAGRRHAHRLTGNSPVHQSSQSNQQSLVR